MNFTLGYMRPGYFLVIKCLIQLQIYFQFFRTKYLHLHVNYLYRIPIFDAKIISCLQIKIKRDQNFVQLPHLKYHQNFVQLPHIKHHHLLKIIFVGWLYNMVSSHINVLALKKLINIFLHACHINLWVKKIL